MKRKLFSSLILLVTSLLSFNLAWAQQPEPRPDPRVQMVQAYLDLSEQQTRRLQGLLRSRSETVDPLIRTLAEQEQELARLLRMANPDPIAVGTVVITIRGTRRQIENAQDTFRNGFEDLLTEEQERKLAGLERYVENERAAPAFLSLGLIEVELGPEPQQTLRKALGPGRR